MPEDEGDRKPSATESDDEELTMVVARDLLGDIVTKARLMGARTVLTRNGKRVAAIVPLADYNRLIGAA